jgi:hypothetical protein
VRLASGMAQWEVEKGGAWRIDRLRNVQRTGHTECRHAGGFDVTSNQSHGLVTHRSDRHEQQDIDVLLS